MSAERLRRYFTKADGGYRVSKAVRDCCIFARQNLTKDPPFSKLDLISCRNVMIYFDRALQDKVHRLFHESLVTFGVLALGHKETIAFSPFEQCYEELDAVERIYRKVR